MMGTGGWDEVKRWWVRDEVLSCLEWMCACVV